MRTRLTLLTLALGTAATLVSATEVATLPRESRVPGGIAYVEIPGGDLEPVATFDGHRAAVVRRDDRWIAVVGIPLATEAGDAKITVSTPTGTTTVPFKGDTSTYLPPLVLPVAPATWRAERVDSRSARAAASSLRAASTCLRALIPFANSDSSRASVAVVASTRACAAVRRA